MNAKRPPKPINRTRRRVALSVGVGVMVIFLAGVAWVSLGHSTDPDYQAHISMQDMSGTQSYLVNLWISPKPAKVGRATVKIQVASSIGTPVPLDSVSLKLLRPNGSQAALVQGKPLPASSKPEDGFEVPVTFDVPGSWRLVVTTDTGGQDNKRESTFAVDITGAS